MSVKQLPFYTHVDLIFSAGKTVNHSSIEIHKRSLSSKSIINKMRDILKFEEKPALITNK